MDSQLTPAEEAEIEAPIYSQRNWRRNRLMEILRALGMAPPTDETYTPNTVGDLPSS